MGLTADRLASLKLVDEVLTEPLGGAHRDPESMALSLKSAVLKYLDKLERLSPEDLVSQRQQRLAAFGEFSEGKA
jgi:acetyl-CoA carboxylase carboxyl transferase subunit alpha